MGVDDVKILLVKGHYEKEAIAADFLYTKTIHFGISYNK